MVGGKKLLGVKNPHTKRQNNTDVYGRRIKQN